jgi:pyruvate dehydrogenase E1 component alpha subunit
MPENPLLPNRKLRELLTLMRLCHKLDRNSHREALLAATTIHLEPGDLLCATDNSLAHLAPKVPKKEANPNGSLLIAPAELAQLPIAAAAARGLQATGKGVALAFANAGSSEPDWQSALTWAHTFQLPLILTITDATGGKLPRRHTLDWPTFSRFAKRIKLPVLTIDGEDAVAIYRCMQESVIRARVGDGPAVLWAVITPASAPKPPRTQRPIARLEAYMSARKISFSA